jgi:hypothetical protein
MMTGNDGRIGSEDGDDEWWLDSNQAPADGPTRGKWDVLFDGRRFSTQTTTWFETLTPLNWVIAFFAFNLPLGRGL